MDDSKQSSVKPFFQTELGQMVLGDSLDVLCKVKDKTVDLIMTSPPFGLVRKKEYGNVDAGEYLNWFRPFAKECKRILNDNGSFVLDIGGAWNQGIPTRHLYHFKLLIMLCEDYGFHLAQDFYWWNPSKLPTPAEWVTVRRIRVKDAINCVWWLSPSPWPKASNWRVLQPYSDSMKELLKNGYKAKKRPSGHDISKKFNINRGAAIPPNLIAIPNTESNSYYLKYCRDLGLKPNPSRYPVKLPEFFIRMLTEQGDYVVDPFAGSCVTGEACEKLGRRWLCIELIEEYLQGAMARFEKITINSKTSSNRKEERYYQIPHLGMLWEENTTKPLPADGGVNRPKQKAKNVVTRVNISSSICDNLPIFKKQPKI